MPKFSEIFQKLESTEEYNKYPFMLAIATDDTLCEPPIPGIGYLDRAFITSTGGCSKIKIRETEDYRNEDSRPEEQYYYFSNCVLHPAKGEELLEKYSFWIPKKDFLKKRDFGTHAVLTSICNFLNKATGNDISIIRDWEIPIDLQYDIYPEIESFIDKATEFIQLELTASTLIDAVMGKISVLRKVADDLDKALDDEPSEWEFSHDGTEYHNGVTTGDPHGESWCRVFFGISEEYWKNTLSLLNEISTFDFDKKFAYCDIAGRQQHIAALADILSQQSLCLFYSKWKELFTWYSNRMQAIPLNKPIPEAGITATMAALESICEKTTLDNISNGCFFLYDDRNNSNIQTIQSSAYFLWNRIPIKPKQKLINQTDWRDVSAASVFKSVQGRDSQFQTVMRNLFWLFSQKHPFIDCDIAFNSTLIAKEIRVFAEFVLKLLCYLGHVPMASIKCKSQMCLNNGQLIHCTGKNGHPIYEIISEFSYYLPDDDRVNSSPCDIKNAILKNFYSGQCGGQLMIILPKINILMDDVSKLLHQEGTFNSTEVKDFLTDISNIVAFIKTLL